MALRRSERVAKKNTGESQNLKPKTKDRKKVSKNRNLKLDFEAISQTPELLFVTSPNEETRDASVTNPYVKPNINCDEFRTSKVMEAVKTFLPKLMEANQNLNSRVITEEATSGDFLNKESIQNEFNIENVDETKPYIEMNIALVDVAPAAQEPITEQNLKLPTQKAENNSKPPFIEVL
eukprot:Sdes_comp23426_c0_seq1m21682